MPVQFNTAAAKKAYTEHVRRWQHCVRCRIGALARHHVFGRGHLPCDILVLGEAPGETEDKLGEPFVGQSGTVLNYMLQISVPHNFSYFITNTVACRPTANGKNRKPTCEEQANCFPQASKLIEIAAPKFALVLGGVAWDWWLATVSFNKIPFHHDYHPSYICHTGGISGAEYSPWCARIARAITSAKGLKS